MNKHTAQRLEQHFDTAFAAPDGIKKLRELILTLAMQGKLVAQDPNDQPAAELLKQIERERLTRSREGVKGKGGKAKSLPEIKPEEIPYPLPGSESDIHSRNYGIYPGHWIWVRLYDICHDWGQKTPDSDFTYIDVGSIDNKNGVVSDAVQLLDSKNAPSRARKLVKKGTVLYSTVRPYLLNVAVIEKDYEPGAIASTAFAILHPYSGINNRFIYYFLRSPMFINRVEKAMKGVAYPAINDGDFFQSIFPLPPVNEQHRIVAKIEQLMVRCDELEKLRAERERRRISVHAAAIKRLTSPTVSLPRIPSRAQGRESMAAENLDSRRPWNDDEMGSLNAAWQFITQHFVELYAVKPNVAELRKAILQLAVMGKLVPQDPNDPPASELLKEIEKQARKMLDSRKVKYRDITETPDILEMQYAIPKTWVWARFRDVVFFQEGPGIRNWQFTTQGVKLLNVSNILFSDRLDLSNSDKYVSQEEFESKYRHFEIEDGDLLFAGSGGSWGKVAWYKHPDFTVMLNTSTMRLKFFHEDFAANYLFYFIKTEFFKEQLSRQLVGLQPNFGSTHMCRIYIPVPPIAEQHRIVAKIDSLMAMCDTLEQQIDAATGKQTELLNALMAQV